MKSDFINPLTYTNYNGIKDVLVLLKESYIEEYGEEYRDEISSKFERSNFILLVKSKELEKFTINFPKVIVKNICEKILNDIKKIEHPNINLLQNIIEKEIKNINLLQYDEDINIYNSIEKIKNKIIDIIKITKQKEIIELLNKQIANLDMNYFKNIDNKFNEQKKVLVELNKAKERIKRQLQRDFLLEHSYILSDEEFLKIFDEKKDIENVIINSKRLSLYLSSFFKGSIFDIGEFGLFDETLSDKDIFIKYRRELLKEHGISFTEEELLDSNVCLSKLNFMFKDENKVEHYGNEGLKVFEKMIEKYNKKYKEGIENIDYYLMSKEEFKRRNVLSDEFLNRKSNLHIKNILAQKNYEFNYEICSEELLKVLENGCADDYNGSEVNLTFSLGNTKLQLIYVMLKPLEVEYDNDRIKTNFLYTLSHEMGHVTTSDDGYYSGINKEKSYINELFNEYLSKKIMDKILWVSNYPENTYCNVENKSLHTLNFFLIEPFVQEYEKEFKEAMINNSLSPLIELFGSIEKLEEYEKVIKEFYTEQQKYDHSKDIYIKNPMYVEYTKERINNIYQYVNLNRENKSK